MARTIITQVGTSLLNIIKDGNSDLRALDEQLREGPLPDDLAKTVYDTSVDLMLKQWAPQHGTVDESPARVNSPGEIASLSLMNLAPEDMVVLVHSETSDGALCAEALKHILTRLGSPQFPGCRVKVVPIAGMRMEESSDSVSSDPWQDRQDFVRTGLANYVSMAWQQFHDLADQTGATDENPHELVFNITGGFKGTIPMVQDMSVLLSSYSLSKTKRVQCKVWYLFEGAPSLIRYGAIPVNIAWNKVPTRMLQEADKPGGIAASIVSPIDAEYFEPVSQDSGRRQPSAVGTVVLALAKHFRPGTVTVE